MSIRETGEHLRVAVADFDGADAMGRISGWVSGDFDFEVVRLSDGKDLFGSTCMPQPSRLRKPSIWISLGICRSRTWLSPTEVRRVSKLKPVGFYGQRSS